MAKRRSKTYPRMKIEQSIIASVINLVSSVLNIWFRR